MEFSFSWNLKIVEVKGTNEEYSIDFLCFSFRKSQGGYSIGLKNPRIGYSIFRDKVTTYHLNLYLFSCMITHIKSKPNLVVINNDNTKSGI